MFPYDKEHSAMGEYHYYPPAGYRGNWYSPITDYGLQTPLWSVVWRGAVLGTCNVIESQALRNQNGSFPHAWNMLVTGDADYGDYMLEGEIRVLKNTNCNGFAFRYQNSRCFYAFCFENGHVKALKRTLYSDTAQVLAVTEFECEAFRVYSVKIACNANTFRMYVDEKEVLTFCDDEYKTGSVAIIGNAPTQFGNIAVYMTEDNYKSFNELKQRKKAEIEAERDKYPQPVLWKKLDLKDFGCGRSVRFGDLTGDGRLNVLFAQCQKRMFKDRYANISCLTAIDLNGGILWQIGEPHPDNLYITADLPVQIADIDGDGRNEVVVSMDFELMVLDGATGKPKKTAPTPLSVEDPKTLKGIPFGTYGYERVCIDCIRICNFSGNKTPTDILVKDRYSRIYAYDNNLNLLWKYQGGNTGHFAFTKDFNGDGREEVFVGYNLLDADGNKLWTLPVPTDHTDEIIAGKFYNDGSDGLKEAIAMVSGDEGFIICDLDGNILLKHMLGHAQRISVGNYLPDRQGYEIAVSTYWGNQGIILLFDNSGKLLWMAEPGTNGNLLTPVNWTGCGQDLILLNGNTEMGGLIDGDNRQVVVFPDDGHPDLCAEAVDITGDGREEIVLWDSKAMYIYTQDTPFKGEKVCAPEKYPLYNASNYRGEYSFKA
jgi:hypothetical protein